MDASRDAFSIGQNSNGNFSFVGTYTGDGFGTSLGLPTMRPVARFKHCRRYDDFKACISTTISMCGLAHDQRRLALRDQPVFQRYSRHSQRFQFQNGKVIVPTGIPQNSQPLTPTLLQLFSDRIEFTGQWVSYFSFSRRARRFAPRIGVSWNPHGCSIRLSARVMESFIRSPYEPDQQYRRHDSFVDNVNLFNDRPPAVPTGQLEIFSSTPIAASNPSRSAMRMGRGFDFLRYALDYVRPGASPSAVHRAVEPFPGTAGGAARCFDCCLRRQSDDTSAAGNRRNDRPRAWSNSSAPPFPQWGPIGLQEWVEKQLHGLQTEIEFPTARAYADRSYVFSKCLDNGTDEGSAPATQLIGANYAVCDSTRQTRRSELQLCVAVWKRQRFLASANPFVNGIFGGWQLPV